MNKPKRKTYVKQYGCEHTERYIQALETYINQLEKALDQACEELAMDGKMYGMTKDFIMYCRKATKEEWKEYLLNDE